jgi:hypothetical protein
MLIGELAFQYEDNVDGCKSYVAQYNVQKAFTCFNGLNRTDKISFAGVIDKEYDSSKPSGDTAVTIRRCGTHTIINTGDRTIAQGNLVYWDWPLTVDAGAGSVVRNRVHIPGESRTKLLPSLRTLRMQDVFALFAEAEHKAYTISRGPASDALKLAAMEDWLNEMQDNGMLIRSSSDAKQAMPIQRYMGWIAATQNIANSWWKQHKTQNFDFMDPIEDSKPSISGPRSRIHKRARTAPTSDVIAPGDARLETLSIVSCVCEQYRLMMSRCIGTALSTAAAGQKVGVLRFVNCVILIHAYARSTV